ncbi:polysaccharide deacetylase family protein [Brevibacillus sp. SYP-B805]|uniref:polysaccharide deacetylase family protein n=1 Tax=Brevibacillus sp. SYP-B805 TaxID=1578199 RepID=UPI0013EC6D9E|nr:polysaccharide deacetylase family protein [Brevibacillus sp. SYP-B805]NGQ94507.1 polysaccharide deacetylase family protein [Brevibacillus sp. SYP-B805]
MRTLAKGFLALLCFLLVTGCQFGGIAVNGSAHYQAVSKPFAAGPTSTDKWKASLQAAKNRFRQVPILMYHCISAGSNNLYVEPQRFDLQLRNLLKQGYTPITSRELVKSWFSGTPLPARPIVLTFDDGYRDNYTNAFPLLKKYRVKATLFVITGAVGKPNYLTWPQIEEMAKSGLVDVESHTVHHPDMSKLTPEQARMELTVSKAMLEAHLHQPVTLFAYPMGIYRPFLFPILREAGYQAAFTTRSGLTQYYNGLYTLKRLHVVNTDTFAEFPKTERPVPPGNFAPHPQPGLVSPANGASLPRGNSAVHGKSGTALPLQHSTDTQSKTVSFPSQAQACPTHALRFFQFAVTHGCIPIWEACD